MLTDNLGKSVFSLERMELLCSVLVICTCLLYCFYFIHAMATTSLWSDELYTIKHFSSEGIKTCVTDYHAPNNHIFFNVLNSLLPGAGSFHPARARLWSFVFMLGAMGSVLWYFFKQKQFVEASLFFSFFFTNPESLSLGLQARGYGFLFFATLCSIFSLFSYLRTKKNKFLLFVAIFSVLGTWTVPTYIFFAGALLLLSFFYRPKLKAFFICLGALVCILVLYLPIYKKLIWHALHYSEHWGRQFASVEAVFITIRQYFLSGMHDWLVFIFLFMVMIVPAFKFGKNDKNDQEYAGSYLILGICTLFFFSACLYMETPIPRTASFIVLPLLILGLFVWTNIYRCLLPIQVRPIVLVIVCGLMMWATIDKIREFSFVPIANWMGTANLLERIFPDDIAVLSTFNPHYLKFYMKNDYEFTDTFSSEKFIEGELVVVDSSFKEKPGSRFNGRNISKMSAEIQIPQKRGGFQSISFAPVRSHHLISEIRIDGKLYRKGSMTDHRADTGWTSAKQQDKLKKPVRVKFTLQGIRKYRSFVIVTKNIELPQNIEIYLTTESESVKLDPDNIQKGNNTLIAILDDKEVSSIDLVVYPFSTKKFIFISEAWLYATK